MFLRSILAFACLLGVSIGSAPAQRVWVVATQPGPGVDFTDIQAAVTAASDGDLVLVHAGTYPGFTIPQKSLVVEGDGPGAVFLNTVANLSITDIDASRSVTLRHIDVLTTTFAPLLVANCAGRVSVEDCRFLAVFAANGTPGVWISGSASTSLVRCEIQGDGARSVGVGLQVLNSAVHVHGCRVYGSSPTAPATSGADACDLRSSTLYATGTTFTGGRGSSSPPTFCIPPGNGGDAIELDAASSARLLDCVLQPGAPGTSGACAPGQPGRPISGAGSATFLPGTTGTLAASSPVRAGNAWSIAVQGPPSATAFLILGARSAPAFLADCRGTVHPDLSGPIVVVGAVLPASGGLAFSFPMPGSLPVLGLPLVTQVFFATPGAGCTVGEPSFPLFLDARY